MNKLALILLIVVIAYVVYTAYPNLTGNVVSKSVDSEKEDFELNTENTNDIDAIQAENKTKFTETQKTELPKEENKINISKSCDGIFCQDSILICPDGFVSSCKNTCTEGLCSTCKSNCIGHEIVEKQQNITCTENWSCSNWSDCLNGEQTRNCTDQNSCETQLKKPEVSQTCLVEQKQLVVFVSTDDQTVVRGNDVQINVRVSYDSNPVENSNIFLNLTYASGTVLQNSSTTNSTGDYFWIKRISGNAKIGIFKIQAEATKEGYLGGFGESSFEVIAKS